MGKRLAAKVLDALFIVLLTGLALAPFLLLAKPFRFAGQSAFGISFLHAKWLLFVPFLIVIVPIAYETAFVVLCGATPAKRLFRLKIVCSSGEPIKWKRSFARTIAQFVSGTIAGLGYLMAFIDWEGRTLHDRICRTVVIDESSERTHGPATTVEMHNGDICPMCGAKSGLAENCQKCGEKLPLPTGSRGPLS